jgi:hypothetical protein
MQQCSHGVSGAPIVDWVAVDGRPIPITCRRDYDTAKRDYYKRVAKNVTFPSLPQNSATFQGVENTHVDSDMDRVGA